jgi:outer membrane protein OmpA-like peptidoglycan-associated protein
MRHFILNRRLLRHSTAISLALTVASPQVLPALAQSEAVVEIDCEATPDAEACAALVEAAPAIETEAEVQVEAEQPVAEEAVVEEPVAEEPVSEEQMAEEPAAAPVEEAVQPEPVETETVVQTEAAPVEEPVAQEEASPAESEQTAEQQEAPAAESEEQPTTDSAEASQEMPASETVVEAEASAETETDAPAQALEPEVAEEPAPSEAPAVETVEMPVEDPEAEVQAQAAAAVAEDAEGPASVVPDDISAEQAADIQVREERRREEARERRNELLGAAAVGAVIGAIIPALGGRVVDDQGDRIIVERDGEFYVRGDEGSLLRDGDVDVRVERLDHGATRETVTRRNGVQIVTVRNAGGYIIYRSRIRRDGREVVLIDNRLIDDRAPIEIAELPPLQLTLPNNVYIVPARQADFDTLYDTFNAEPVTEIKERYSLRQVRENEGLRALVRRVDLDSITFETGQATVRASQVPQLEDLARAAIALINQDPETLLLVEGHTDAIGSDISNLALSDRRAETVARILANVYGVPPENMIVQGYGESYLKVDTQSAEEANRRVTIRNITPLVVSSGG